MSSSPPHSFTWDIYCKVIDNYGDIGVCWRLCADLGSRGHAVRLFVDDASALVWMAPRGAPNVQVFDFDPPAGYESADVVIEAFGCELPQLALASIGRRRPVWINLEYLTAEGFAERQHGLSSPVTHGPAAGVPKFFFYPGFTAKTGGLIREAGRVDQPKGLSANDRSEWLTRHASGLSEVQFGERWISLFCYEPASLERMLDEIATLPGKTRLLVTHGRATVAVRATVDASAWSAKPHTVELSFLSPMPQTDYDELLQMSDFNFVRGEDSVVRAIWAGKPFVWQIYQQEDDAHVVKLDAFLSMAKAPDSWRQAHYAWNSVGGAGPLGISPETLAEWRTAADRLRSSLVSNADLTTQLADFVRKKR